jgi:glycosyltransferase involved in cell wall biosynthesis
MKVCFISNATELGGAERVLLETVDVLKERGIECRVLLPGNGELAQEFGKTGVPYTFLDGGSWVTWERPSPWNRAKAVAKISGKLFPSVRKVRRWGCDAIYSNSLTVCGGAVVARLLNLPHIWHLHEFGKEFGVCYKFGEAFSNRAIGRLSSVCILVSNALAAKYGRFIAPSKLRVVYPSMHRELVRSEHSAAQSTVAPAPGGRFRLVIVGGLVEGKGQEEAMQALAHLVREGVNAELVMVGESYPAYRRTLEEIARSNALLDRISFVGRVRDASPFLRTADVVLVCSRWEAFGRVTIEAMLAGKAVVGAAAGATPELVQDGFNGLLYKCGDPADLAAKVRFLTEHPAVLRQLGENGERWAATRFTRERYGEELMAIITSLARPGSVPRQGLADLVAR